MRLCEHGMPPGLCPLCPSYGTVRDWIGMAEQANQFVVARNALIQAAQEWVDAGPINFAEARRLREAVLAYREAVKP